MSMSSSEWVICVRRLVAVGVLDLEQLLLDDVAHPLLVAEDLAQLADPLEHLRVLGAQLVRLERGEPLQAQVEDGLGLDAREVEALHQPVARGVGVRRSADELDHRVDVGDRDEQALEDVQPRLALAQLVLGPAHDDVPLVLDVGVDHLAQGEELGHPVDQRDGVDAEGALQRRELEQVVENDLGDGVALELDHQADAGLARLVAEVGDLRDAPVLNDLGDLLDQARAVVAPVALGHLVGQLGDDDRLLAPPDVLGVGLALHDDPAPAGLVGVLDPLPALDDPARGEVGALDVLHEPGDVDERVVDEGHHAVDHLGEVVRRDVRGHPDGDAGGAVDQQVGEARRHHRRLEAGVVVGRREVHRVRVDVAQHLGGQPREARLRVAHRGGRVVVDRAEVALPVHQRLAHGEVLRQADQRVVDRRVAVRVELRHHLAHRRGGLLVRPRRPQAALVHRVEHAAVDRLQPVANVGQRPAHDHAHRVVEVGGAHLLLEPAGLDVAAGEDVGAGHLARPPRHQGSSRPWRLSR